MIKKFKKNKLFKKVCLSLLTLAMSIGMVSMTPVAAAAPTFDANKQYAIVDTKGRAIMIRKSASVGPGTKEDCPHAEGIVIDGKAEGMAIFKVEKNEDYYSFYCEAAGGLYLELENETNLFHWNKYPDVRGHAQFALEEVDGGYVILSRQVKDTYLKINNETLLVECTKDKGEATVFTFKEVELLDISIYFENVGTKDYISFKDQADKGKVKLNNEVTDTERFNPVFVNKDGQQFVTLQSKGLPGYSLVSAYWNNGQLDGPFALKTGNTGGWESIIIEPNGDETVSLKSSAIDKYVYVNDQNELDLSDLSKNQLGDEAKFVVHSISSPNAPTDLAVVENTLEATTVSLKWNASNNSIVSAYEIQRKAGDESTFTTIAKVGITTYTDDTLSKGTNYTYRVRAILGKDEDKLNSDYTAELNMTTLNGVRPVAPENIAISDEGNDKLKLTWDEVEGATEYIIYKAPSAYGNYEEVARVNETSYEDTYTTASKFEQYYRVAASNEYGKSAITGDRLGLETELFGKNTLVFADTDDATTVDKVLGDLFTQQNDGDKDAQFKADHYQVYFKPGDYTKTSCMYLGFYTAFNGLGKTPYDVKLNNIAIPAYLDDNNATCNFWRSAENLSIINTGNKQGNAGYGSWRADWFNWAVAQAAPLRRVYSERPVAYDWNYGWASGGYVADCKFTGADKEGNTAGTWSGQQFYTRNSEWAGNAFGTTLNNFFQGVTAPNLPTTDTEGWKKLQGVDGYSNWSILNDKGEHQVVTTINETAQSKEKPFLFLDDNGEYKVFVPALRENTSGVSWSETDMGEGNVLSLDSFYIAKPTDTAKEINAQIDAGKNIYFTPGVYHAEETINVDKANVVILGTGMATIIPDNSEAAIEIADVDGVVVSGLIFDAGQNSKYLLKVGEDGDTADHSANPTLLQDLFFRIGGTTDSVTSADVALEINSNNVLCDHFWIWRADHGAGVTWTSNPATNGLIVNGDNVSCYALFDEHFEEYDVLWNGENGATYFLQNEKCYDPISQEDWMSHLDTTAGYAVYKVSNKVKNHYAVGLGIYNVLINTGEDRDGSVPIEMENAVEVPNHSGVLVENACIQTFANEEAALQKFNHIINGVGEGVSSGVDKVNNITGEGWSRKFLISYNDGTAVLSDGTIKGKNTKIITVEDVQQPMNDIGDVDVTALVNLYNEVKDYEANGYTKESWEVFKKALDVAEGQVTNPYPLADGETDPKTCIELWGTQLDAITAYANLKAAVEQLEKEVNIDTSKLQDLYNANVDRDKSKYTADSWADFEKALNAAGDVLANQNATQEDVDNAYNVLDAAINALKEKTSVDNGNTGDKPTTGGDNNGSTSNVDQETGENTNKVKTSDSMMIAPYVILAVCAAGAYVSIKRKHI